MEIDVRSLDAIGEAPPPTDRWGDCTGPWRRPADVYRCVDQSGRLLYVGMSWAVLDRLRQHRMSARKTWWDLVARIEVERFATANAASQVEMATIRSERPIYNKLGKPNSLEAAP